jgi:glutamate transport system permease protein
VVLKDTSLGFIITYEDVLRISNTTIIPALRNPIQVYFIVGLIFISINYLLSKVAQYTQRRLARGRKTAAIVGPHAPAALAAEVDAVDQLVVVQGAGVAGPVPAAGTAQPDKDTVQLGKGEGPPH